MHTSPEMEPALRIVAAIVRDKTGRVLLVRKRNTQAFMQPGGKRELGETDLDALDRELREELVCILDRASARFVGVARAPAANEPGRLIEATLYAARVSGPILPAAEIAEALWVAPDDPGSVFLAPLTRDHVLPWLRDALALP